jgi:pentatricopeptide repeat protein
VVDEGYVPCCDICLVQVFHGIMGVYAKKGDWQAVQQILELMEAKGCVSDIITFNTVINARCKGELQPGMALAFLKEVRKARVKPDLITFNTLLGGCIANKNFSEAREVVKEMVRRGYEPDAYSKYLLGKKNLLHEIG